jgi:hypothetical protein
VSTSTGTNLKAVLLACAGFYAGLSFGLLLASFLRDWVPSGEYTASDVFQHLFGSFSGEE